MSADWIRVVATFIRLGLVDSDQAHYVSVHITLHLTEGDTRSDMGGSPVKEFSSNVTCYKAAALVTWRV